MLTDLFAPVELGALSLQNRIIMAPMTRSRATVEGTPTPEMADYYAQRAGAGLIISEGIQPNADGQGYCRTPGLHSKEHLSGWTSVTRKVADAGGTMIAQLMHVGRIASHLNKAPAARTLAPSSIRASGEMYTDAAGMVELDIPEVMSRDDIDATISSYALAAKMALDAGFQGIELHATSGYLPAQFLSTGSNKREDGYGGSLSGRLRFVVELIEALNSAIGADRVGLRICPANPFNDLQDEDPEATFRALLQAISPMGIAYLHVIRMARTGLDNFAIAKSNFKGPLVFNDSFSAQEADGFISSGRCSAVSFARPFIANPDFPARILSGADLAKFDPKRLYTKGSKGYSDYPTLPQR